MLNEMEEWIDDSWIWNLNWRRNRWTKEEIHERELIHRLEGKIPINDNIDRWIWKEDEDGQFTDKSAYLLLSNHNEGDINGVFKPLWKLKIAPNAQHLRWRVFLDRFPTKVNLINKDIQLSNARCILCNEKDEIAKHLFLNCK